MNKTLEGGIDSRGVLVIKCQHCNNIGPYGGTVNKPGACYLCEDCYSKFALNVTFASQVVMYIPRTGNDAEYHKSVKKGIIRTSDKKIRFTS